MKNLVNASIFDNYFDSYIYKARFYLVINSYISFGVGFFGNILLFKILWSLKSKDFETYRKILIHSAISDIIFSLTIGYTMLSMEPIKGNLVAWCFGVVNYLPNFWMIFFVMFHIQSYFLSLSNNIITFTYRYNILVRNYKFTNYEYIIFCCAVILWNVIELVIWCMALLDVTEIDKKYVESILDPTMLLNLEGKYGKYLIFKVLSIKGGIGTIFTLLTVGIIGMTVTFTTYRINNIMNKKKEQLSIKTQQINKQLTISMLLNVSISMVLDVLPVGILLLSAIFGFQMYGYAHIFFYTFEYQPSLNMIICLTFVKPCRNEFLRLIGIKKSSIIVMKSGTFPITVKNTWK